MINKKTVNETQIYHGLTPEEATLKMNALRKMMAHFWKKSKISSKANAAKSISCNDALLLKIIDRVDQRSDYFFYFHSTVSSNGKLQPDFMSQNKEIALLCYWIIKYKPLTITNPELEMEYYKDNHCTINDAFAAYIFISQIRRVKSLSKKQKDYYGSWDYKEDLFYKFMHHDISKEAMIFSLCSILEAK